MTKPNTIERLVKVFAESTAKQTDAIWRGDAATGNRFAKRRVAAFRRIRAVGDEGREAMLSLFRHPSPDVRTMAAAYLLRYRTKESLRVLRKVAAGKGLIAFEASEAIKRWEEGDWSLDPA